MRRSFRRYSIFSLIAESRQRHRAWPPSWPKAVPKKAYDVVIIGGGGHGLATAYYLAKLHGVANVAVLERGWLGGGNTARNTAIIRSNYLRPESMALYGLSHSLFEHLSAELNFNIMYSPRGLIELAYSRKDLETLARVADANRHFGIRTWMVPPDEAASLVPALGSGQRQRDGLLGALWQPHGAIARHDAVAWAYARMASDYGVDIIEDCEAEPIVSNREKVRSVVTSKGTISAGAVVVAAAADTPSLVAPLGIELPIEPVNLQAFVSQPVKPVLDVVVVAGAATGGYVSQSDKGELVIGGATDRYPGYSRRGSFASIESTAASLLELFPSFSRLRMMRQWGGTVDITPDRSPIMGAVGPDGLYVNCGWGTGGFKAIPGSGYVMASLLQSGKSSNIAAPFSVDRFAQGRLIDESAASAVLH